MVSYRSYCRVLVKPEEFISTKNLFIKLIVVNFTNFNKISVLTILYSCDFDTKWQNCGIMYMYYRKQGIYSSVLTHCHNILTVALFELFMTHCLVIVIHCQFIPQLLWADFQTLQQIPTCQRTSLCHITSVRFTSTVKIRDSFMTPSLMLSQALTPKSRSGLYS